jgi:hypothetical protein
MTGRSIRRAASSGSVVAPIHADNRGGDSLALAYDGRAVWERTSCAHPTLDDLDADVSERYLNLRDEWSRRNLAHMACEEMLLKLRCAARDLDGQVWPTTVVKQRNSINGSMARSTSTR